MGFEKIEKPVHERSGRDGKIEKPVHERSSCDKEIVWPVHERVGGDRKNEPPAHDRSEGGKKILGPVRGWLMVAGNAENASAAGWRRQGKRETHPPLVGGGEKLGRCDRGWFVGGGRSGEPVRDRALAVVVQPAFP